ncbi:paraneoplastic antigen Ma2-like [Pseudophryne corroboree]|uniref:paraneoplastic antigen Ma2-like n=1 Tax=Pseudophryne corroboree TaxID=495146 RepID=UPI0030813936
MENITGKDIFLWSQQKGKDPRKCIAVVGNFSAFSDADVISQIGTLFGVMQPQVIDKWRGELGMVCAFLIENKNELDPYLIPAMMMADRDTGRRWSIIMPAVSEGDDRITEASAGDINVGQRENSGNSAEGVEDNNTPVNTNEEKLGTQFETIVDRVVTQLERWHYEGSYRRLRVFSGMQPVPQGEETYEVWKEAAVQQTEEWQCPDHIKRQRVVESLRGPAMGVIQAARRSNPKATLETYFEALDYAYGTLEDVGDLISRLHHTFQETGEKLSTYLFRLDRLLYKIIEKGGMKKTEVDENRVKQLLRGALTKDPIAQKLRCSEISKSPPAFNELMREIKMEETMIDMRERTVKKVKVVCPTVESSTLEEKICKMIEEQNKKIDQFISSQSRANAPQSNTNVTYPPLRGMGRGYRYRQRGCFTCGELGHRAAECSQSLGNQTNTDQVTERGNGRGRPVTPALAP